MKRYIRRVLSGQKSKKPRNFFFLLEELCVLNLYPKRWVISAYIFILVNKIEKDNFYS